MSVYQPWRVVETRLDDQLRNAGETVYATMGARPMTEWEAKQLASQERGRYAGADPKRLFRAEAAPAPDPDRCACGHSISRDHYGPARTCWHELPGSSWCGCADGQPALPAGVR